jgi:putative drug exporter of the RND superfamily
VSRTRRTLRWLLPALAVLLWLGLSAPLGGLSGKLSQVQQNDNAAFLPSSAESTRVTELQRRFAEQQALPVLVLWEADGPLDQAARDAIAEKAAELTGIAERSGALASAASPPIPSADGRAAQVVLPLRTDQFDRLPDLVAQLRAADAVPGTTAYVTGPAGVFADFAGGFSGIDGVLLAAAFGIVLLILLVVYRSPVLPLLVIGTAGLALVAGNAVAYLLAREGLITVNGQSQGISSILVVGAATDYGLLLVSRYREELHREQDRFTAMRRALRRAAGPVVASGATVILGVLCLLLSDLASDRGLGPISAVNVAFAVVAALTFLPAALALLGRAAFWPFRPAAGTPARSSRGWARVAATVGRHPARVLVVSVLGLAVLACFAPTFDARGIPTSQAVRGGSESATGLTALARHYDAGSGSPAVVVTPVGRWQDVARAAAAVPGVAGVQPVTGATGGPPATEAAPREVDGLVQLDATLRDAADSDAAEDTVRALRTAVRGVDPAALVGGDTATTLDTLQTSARDLRVVVPAVLLVITVVLALLLRAVVAPLLLVATVVLSFAATIGLGALLFGPLLGSSVSDPGIVLVAFVFLVALGVDYNIFLMTRAREESAREGTRRGVLTALAVTGGVITSAGLVLAATFGALAVLPLVLLVQLGFLVGAGVLLDTFVVRTLVVPAAVRLLGDRTWWPGRPTAPSAPPDPRPAPPEHVPQPA